MYRMMGWVGDLLGWRHNDLEECINSLCESFGFERRWISVKDPFSRTEKRVHVVCRSKGGAEEEEEEEEPFVCLHGVASSAFRYTDIINRLPPSRSAYSFDLPGYGVSDNLDIPDGATGVEVAEAYADVLAEAIAGLGLSRVHVVGHSFGGMLAFYLERRHPDLVARMTIVSPAGLLPTLGSLGYYWAMVFYWGLPNSVLRATGLGRVIEWLTPKLISDASTKLNIYIVCHPTANGHLNLSRFIGFYGQGTIAGWSHPCFRLLCAVKAPLSLVFGSDDTIIPAHQTEVVSMVFDKPVTVVDGMGHTGEMNVTSILGAMTADVASCMSANRMARRVADLDDPRFLGRNTGYMATLSRSATMENVRASYRDWREVIGSREGLHG